MSVRPAASALARLFFVPSVVAVPVLVFGTTARCRRCHEPVYWPSNQWDVATEVAPRLI